VIIFDCNGVLVDSEPIAAGAMSDALKRVGLAASAETVMRRFHGLRPADICAAVETAARRRLPSSFPMDVAAETLHRLRAQLRSIPHAEHA
jgi:beta-phosphoglucomutase-like phosphatase (HAD superfamily)